VRARYPDREGFVEDDGVRVFYEVYGDGDPTIFMLPTWSIVHSRNWKGQIPYLARHYRVLACDPRGNGRTDRPARPDDYAEQRFADDALAVMDATATERAVLVSLSRGAQRSMLLAAAHPDRVAGIVFIAPAVPLPPAAPRAGAEQEFLRPAVSDEGWHKWNAEYWRRDYRGFVEFFFDQIFTEPHSTKQWDDGTGWGLETDPETLIATELAPRLTDEAEVRALLARIPCPLLVIHGTDDAIRPYASGAALAELAGARLVTLEGSGHGPQARIPVKVNLLLREFVESLRDRAPAVAAVAGRTAP
jgi:pimeloyl-ACP methyl ester carboxylesterase